MSDKTGLVAAVLRTKDTIENVPVVGTLQVVKPLNPVRWGRLGKILGSGFVVTVSLISQRLIGNIGDTITSWFDGLADWIGGDVGIVPTTLRVLNGVEYPQAPQTGLFGVTFARLARSVDDLTPSLDSLGFSGILMALVIVLLVLYTLNLGVRETVETLRGNQ